MWTSGGLHFYVCRMLVSDETKALELLVGCCHTHSKGTCDMQLDFHEAFRGVYGFYGDIVPC
jgi:hypothetical protein